MGNRNAPLAIIERAEKEVLSVLAEEAKSGRYEGMEFARLVALGLRNLRRELTGLVSESGGKQEPSSHGIRAERSTKKNRKKKGAYPKFQVADGALVKIGWSKKGKAEYRQRIPEGVYHKVVSVLGRLRDTGNGSQATDEILAEVELGGEHIPSYQTYAVLRFLRDSGVIRMPSRGEYLVSPDVATKARAAFLGSEPGS